MYSLCSSPRCVHSLRSKFIFWSTKFTLCATQMENQKNENNVFKDFFSWYASAICQIQCTAGMLWKFGLLNVNHKRVEVGTNSDWFHAVPKHVLGGRLHRCPYTPNLGMLQHTNFFQISDKTHELQYQVNKKKISTVVITKDDLTKNFIARLLPFVTDRWCHCTNRHLPSIGGKCNYFGRKAPCFPEIPHRATLSAYWTFYFC